MEGEPAAHAATPRLSVHSPSIAVSEYRAATAGLPKGVGAIGRGRKARSRASGGRVSEAAEEPARRRLSGRSALCQWDQHRSAATISLPKARSDPRSPAVMQRTQLRVLTFQQIRTRSAHTRRTGTVSIRQLEPVVWWSMAGKLGKSEPSSLPACSLARRSRLGRGRQPAKGTAA
jgi:hypothetical protein